MARPYSPGPSTARGLPRPGPCAPARLTGAPWPPPAPPCPRPAAAAAGLSLRLPLLSLPFPSPPPCRPSERPGGRPRGDGRWEGSLPPRPGPAWEAGTQRALIIPVPEAQAQPAMGDVESGAPREAARASRPLDRAHSQAPSYGNPLKQNLAAHPGSSNLRTSKSSLETIEGTSPKLGHLQIKTSPKSVRFPRSKELLYRKCPSIIS